jgi:phosphonate utilization transcriptional regulator
MFIVDNLQRLRCNDRPLNRPETPPAAMRAAARPPDAAAGAPGAAIEMLRSHSLTTLVLGELRRQIVGGELAGGAKLNEADIAARLRVSRGPVREAFRALEQSGLVRTEKNRGVFVRQLSLREADEIYELRAALDALIGRLAAQRIRPDQLQRLRDIIKQMQALARSRDVDAYFELNLAFHEVLAEAAGNAALLDNYRRVVNELNLFRHETLARDAEHIPVSTKDHDAIVQAVARGDSARAERLLFEHVMDSRERLHAALHIPPPGAAARPRRAPAGLARQGIKT